MNSIIEQRIVEQAKRKVGFKIHFTIFIILIPANWIIWYFTDRHYLWPVWPLLGWGLGIFFHYIGVYHADKFFSVNREVAKIRSSNKW